MKTKSVYFCQNCGYESVKWLGQCPSCKEWNTFAEEKINVPAKGKGNGIKGKDSAGALKLSEIKALEEVRMKMPSSELNRVLGGGLVVGSLTLIGGEPGIGKSTLLLQNMDLK